MPGSRDQFDLKSPSRILERATYYAKTLNTFHELPKATSKSMVVSQVAKNEREEIDYAINHSKFQLELYRQKEQNDFHTRTHYSQKLQSAIEKVGKNETEIAKKKEKKAEDYNKHLVNTFQRYQSEERRHRDNEKEQSYKLRKQLQEFYDKEEERKKIAELKQISVGTQYQKAVERINRIQQQNQEYSFKAEMELNKELRRNDHSNEILKAKRRALSAMNDDKSRIYEKSMSIFDGRETQFIQKYANNEEGALTAWKHKEEDEDKTKKRLTEFFKKRVERWSMEKHRVDERRAEVPQKCLDILDKTSRSAFNRTVSTFRSSSNQWENMVQRNKSLIRERDELRKDEIMQNHLDLRLKNNSSFKISEKMGSMRHHARKMANSYL